jgi:hypothetical protein
MMSCHLEGHLVPLTCRDFHCLTGVAMTDGQARAIWDGQT